MIKLLHTNLKKFIAHSIVYSGRFLRVVGMKRIGLGLILKGRRVDEVTIADSIIQNIIQTNIGKELELHKLLPRDSDPPIEKFNSRILILKLPILENDAVIEKGVIIFKFTETFLPVYFSLDLCFLRKYFNIILEPSWAGYSIAEILIWTALSPQKVIVLSPDEADFRFLTKLKSNLVPVPLGAADWVNPNIFYKVYNVKKIYDVIYVANFNPAKRVDRYIRAIIRINRNKKTLMLRLFALDMVLQNEKS